MGLIKKLLPIRGIVAKYSAELYKYGELNFIK